MKREFLEGLGLEKALVDRILDENSRDIGRQKQIAEAALKSRGELKQQLKAARDELEAAGGEDMESLRSRLEETSGALAQAQEQHRKELESINRRMETREFLAGYRFVNDATREYYAQRLEEAAQGEENAGRSKKELLDAMVNGEDGMPRANIFAAEAPERVNSVVLPPAGGMRDTCQDNPFSKENWNMAEQARLYREDRERARFLAREAGKTVF